MLDHTSIAVRDYSAAKKFYDETLATLGYKRIMDVEHGDWQGAGYGTEMVDGKEVGPTFWLSGACPSDPKGSKETIGNAAGVHFAFSAPSVEAIQAWHEKCLALGASDNGKPGPRPHYHPGYYAAFVVDPDGWRLEAVLHTYNSA